MIISMTETKSGAMDTTDDITNCTNRYKQRNPLQDAHSVLSCSRHYFPKPSLQPLEFRDCQSHHLFIDAFLDFDIKDVIVDFAFDDFVVNIAKREGIHADHVLAYTTRYRLVGLMMIIDQGGKEVGRFTCMKRFLFALNLTPRNSGNLGPSSR